MSQRKVVNFNDLREGSHKFDLNKKRMRVILNFNISRFVKNSQAKDKMTFKWCVKIILDVKATEITHSSFSILIIDQNQLNLMIDDQSLAI